MKASLSAAKKMALGELCLTIQRKGKNAVNLTAFWILILIFAWQCKTGIACLVRN